MKRIILSMFTLVFLFSCSNDDESGCNAMNAQVEAGFYALKVSNSWVYKNYAYNNITQQYEDSGVIDSVEITATEIINDNTYFKFRTLTSGNDDNNLLLNANGETTELLRDSIGYLIWETGTIKFTNNDFSERTLNEESWGTTFEALQAGTNDFTVEAGTFPCINSERYAKSNPDGELLPGLDRIYYSDGVGLIHGTLSFVSSNVPAVESRLDSYNVQ